MTYESLIESLLRWTVRESDTDLEAELPRLIDSTERKVARVLKTLLSRQNVTGTLQIGNALVQKPTRLLEAISWRFLALDPVTNTYTKSVELKKRTYEYIREVYPGVNVQNAPVYYSDYDYDYHYVGPDPDYTYSYQLTYYERPEPLGIDNSTNFLTEFAPDLMLYGLLLEASPFLTDAEVDMWTNMYQGKIRDLGLEDDDRKIPESQKLKGSRS